MDLPLLTPEERQAADAEHERDPWRTHLDQAREHVHLPVTGLYMGYTTGAQRKPVFLDPPEVSFPLFDMAEWQRRFIERINRDSRGYALGWQRRSNHSFPRAVDLRGTLHTQRALARLFGVPWRWIGWPVATPAQRRLRTQWLRTERRAARRARRARRGR